MRLLVSALIILWLQLFWALVPAWRHGEYYEYGWFVPVLALGLAWRRWRMVGAGEEAGLAAGPGRVGWWAAGCVVAVVLVAPLRLVAAADPGWRPPLVAHAAVVCGVTVVVVGRVWGWPVLRSLLWVIVFALSAVPWLGQVEHALVHRLTGWVVALAREAFLLAGRPVELLGDRLRLGSDVVEITGGCSGIRSLQSLVMVALFFGELLLLTAGRRLALVAVAGACAVAFNTARAVWLAHVHFSHGKEAAAASHDLIGNTCFLAGAAALFLAARWMAERRRGTVVVRRSKGLTQLRHF